MQNSLLRSLFKKQLILIFKKQLIYQNILLRPLFQKQLIYAKQLVAISFSKTAYLMKNKLLRSLFKK